MYNRWEKHTECIYIVISERIITEVSHTLAIAEWRHPKDIE